MNDSLSWLALTVLATGLMWIPYILNSFAVRGMIASMGYADDLPPLAGWAQRAKKAHYNAIENMVLFAAVISGLAILGHRDGTVATVASVYFGARIAHYIVYAAKVPVLRTLTFATGWGATMYLAVELFKAVGS